MITLKEKIIQYVKENLYGLILPIACPTHPMMILVNGEKVTIKFSNINLEEKELSNKATDDVLLTSTVDSKLDEILKFVQKVNLKLGNKII